METAEFPPTALPVKKYPKYEQKGSDCARYSVRIAAEIVCGRKMTGEENSVFFDKFNTCVRDASELSDSIPKFLKIYRNWPVVFENVGNDDGVQTSDKIKKVLYDEDGNRREGHFAVIQANGMDFPGTRIVQGKGDFEHAAHAMCVVDWIQDRYSGENGDFIIQDSNSFKRGRGKAKTWKKRLSASALDKGAKTLRQFKEDGDVTKLIRNQNKILHCKQVYDVYRFHGDMDDRPMNALGASVRRGRRRRGTRVRYSLQNKLAF